MAINIKHLEKEKFQKNFVLIGSWNNAKTFLGKGSEKQNGNSKLNFPLSVSPPPPPAFMDMISIHFLPPFFSLYLNLT